MGLRYRTLPDVVFQRRVDDAYHGLACRGDQRQTSFATLKAALDRRRPEPTVDQ